MPIIAPDFVQTDLGSIQIAPEVIEVIAGLATCEVQGVVSMSSGFVGGIAELLGKKNFSQGVKVEIGQKDVTIEVSILAEFGLCLQDIAFEIQQKVKNAIEMMTSLSVHEVHVHIQDIQLPRITKLQEEESLPARVR